MTQETLTIHDALSAIKVADSRIEKEINNAEFCVANCNSNTQVNGVSLDDFNSTAQSSFQSINDLINRRDALKEAIAQSNAKTTIKVNGKDYTIAEALFQLTEGLEVKRELLDKLREDYFNASSTVNKKNEEVRDKCDRAVTDTYGTKEKASEADMEAYEKFYMVRHSYTLIDPLNILDKIQKLSDEIDKLSAEFDSKIQTSNATTNITIEY